VKNLKVVLPSDEKSCQCSLFFLVQIPERPPEKIQHISKGKLKLVRTIKGISVFKNPESEIMDSPIDQSHS